MDLGIRGRTALVCAASKGLGKGCAMALAREGVNLVITARRKGRARAAPREEKKQTTRTGGGRARPHDSRSKRHVVRNNAGVPPPGDFRNWAREDWLKAIDANMLTPIELIKATVDGMMARKFGSVVNITPILVK